MLLIFIIPIDHRYFNFSLKLLLRLGTIGGISYLQLEAVNILLAVAHGVIVLRSTFPRWEE